MKVLIADDHELVLDTLVAFIEASGNMSVVTAPDFPSAKARIAADGPFDLVLLDLNMPGMNGMTGLKEAIALEGAKHVALITGDASKALAEQAIELGASGFVPKTLPAKSLVNAIQFMAMGEQYMPVGLMTADDDATDHPLAKKLTGREQQVLKGLTEGKSNKEIARDLDLSEPTIKLHVKTLYRKVGAANRTQAALIAKEAGLF
ncbi:response regulator [Primorskyibacter sp. S187A]|uniref:response regulator n=1 Tax=Primorskyibacter sp. S187A TaxID=3415130 RepID=UPI003C7DA39D